MNNRHLSYAAVAVVLALSLMYSVDAEAVIGQKYFGDGTTPDGAGGWSYANALDGSCLVCHIPDNPYSAPNKSTYLLTGHKNALKKATVSSFWNGPDGLIYDTDSSGRTILWNTPGPISLGTSTQHPPTLDGSCSLWGYLNQSACQSAGGTWTSTNNSLFYIYGGWMNAIAGAGAFNDPSTSIAAPGSVSNGGSYSCARCHTTGVTLNTTVSTTRPPERTYPGINGYVNFDPDGNGPATTVSWATGFAAPFQSLEGVQCERCHDATRHFVTGPTVPKGVDATALCLQCHRQEHTVSYTSGGIGANIHPTPFSDNTTTLPASDPTYSLPAIEVGRSDGSYGQTFWGYSTGMEFLNSVHSRFTGTFQQINNTTKYNSGFSYGSCDLNGYAVFYDQPSCESAGGSWSDASGCTLNQAICAANSGTWTVLQGGCTTCHDVHNSMFVDAQAGKALKVQCADCHIGQTPGAGVPTQINIAEINHPATAGTPFDTSKFDNVCVVCHMATQAVANGNQISMPAHLWRINTSATYSTWPSVDQFNGTNGHTMDKRATMVPETYTLPDGVSQATYTNAVWLDVDLACGQCHGGSAGLSATKNGAPYFTKAGLATGAANMHIDHPAPAGTTPVISHGTVTQTGYLVSFTDSSTDTGDKALFDAVTVNWGDGATDTGVRGGVFTHTYTGRARNVSIVHMARNYVDSDLYAKESISLTVPVRYTVSGTVYQSNGTTAITNASVYLKQNNHTTKIVNAATGSFTFTNVLPGSYTIHVYKSGVTFGADALVSVSSNTTQNIKAITP
jgi:Polysaccharide lyase family 4, domain II